MKKVNLGYFESINTNFPVYLNLEKHGRLSQDKNQLLGGIVQ